MGVAKGAARPPRPRATRVRQRGAAGRGASRPAHSLTLLRWGKEPRASPRRGEGLALGVWGNPVSPYPTRWEGLGGLRPPKNDLIFCSCAAQPHGRLT